MPVREPLPVPSTLPILRSAIPLLFALSIAGNASGQAPASTRALEAELGAAAFFGNTSSVTLTGRTSAALANVDRELSADARYAYGRVTERDGDAFVNKRSWAVGLTFDHHPLSRVSPFAFAGFEGSLERRVDLRTNAGLGAKYTFVRSETAKLDVSLALLGERTTPSEESGLDPEERLRWSGRLRARKAALDGRLTFQSGTFWMPSFDRLDEFTLSTTNSVGVSLSERLSLKMTLLESYDSEATARGARSNHDAQLTFSLLATLSR